MMMKKFALLPLILLLALLSVGTAVAQAPVSAALSAPEEPLTVGDPVLLTLTVTHPDGYRVIPPDLLALEEGWGDFVVSSQAPAQTVANGDGTSTTTIVIDARLFAPGEYSTPPLVVSVTDGAGQLSEVTAVPAAVRINSVLIEGDSELRDIKPQADLPFANWLPWLLGGLLLALVVGGVFWLRRRRQARLALAAVDTRLPHEIALDDLAAIERLGLPEQGRFKEHYSLVTDTLRRYLEGTYDIPMMERTTGEIRAELRRTPLDRETKQRLLSFLQESDFVKFADITPRAADAHALTAEGRALVEATRPAPAAAPEAASFSENGRGAKSESVTHE
jgi:hypothetical protein